MPVGMEVPGIRLVVRRTIPRVRDCGSTVAYIPNLRLTDPGKVLVIDVPEFPGSSQ
jgi:hypothetical protein